MIESRLRAAPLIFVLVLVGGAFGQAVSPAAAVELGSQTAKGGFRNEDEIRDKFNGWKTDEDAKGWLVAMKYELSAIENVFAAKPHGEKADVEVRVRTRAGEKVEGISIKLVSNPNGFNQIDKRWLATYAKMWRMPSDVVNALKYFVGEMPPVKTQAGSLRSDTRMYLNELTQDSQKAVVDFFAANRDEIVSDLFKGDGTHAASWFMVAYKPAVNTRWTLRNTGDVVKFYGEGKVEITRAGNLKIGRITMQRKGGDGGRATAKMLQFKINPAQLFDAQ
ncbi:MAG: hypothetical protein KBD94_09855 [Pyrinomonadaceae bacterium]|nr:hypothetical protein [Pyrinomonadaceae bacterium]